MPPRVQRQTPSSRPPPRPAANGILGRVQSASLGNHGLSMLLYGEPGTGKTTFYGTWPRPMLVLVCSGVLRPDDLISLPGEVLAEVDTLVLEKSEDMEEIAAALVKEPDRYETVVLDHCTGYQDLVLSEILKVPLEKLPVQKPHRGLATMQNWGQMSARFKETLKPVLNLVCNRVFVCHEKLETPKEEDKGSELARSWIRYRLAPDIGGWLAGSVNNVCRMSKEPRMRQVETTVGDETMTTWVRDRGVDFCLRIQEHDFFASKVRKPRSVILPEYLRDPSYAKFVAALNGESVE